VVGQRHQRVGFRQVIVAIFTNVEIADGVTKAELAENRNTHPAEITNRRFGGHFGLGVEMPDGAHELSAGQRPTGNTEYYLLLLAGALGADGGADCLVPAERASLIHSGRVIVNTPVYLLKHLLVEEEQPVVVVALEGASLLDLLKHQR
jgi:hypothetical protein